MISETETLPHILVVDDIPAISKIAGIVLRKEGKYRVSYAKSGVEALQQIEEETPDLILLDIEMPKMGGYEVCQRLKRSSLYRDIPVIFLTAMDSISDTITGFKAGGADYITKPFVPAILLARVETHLDLFLSKRRETAMKGHLENILSSMNEGLVVLDAQRIIQQINPKLESLCGSSELELIGKPFNTLFADQGESDTALTDRKLRHSSGEEIPVRILSASLSEQDKIADDGSSVLLIHDIRELLSAESSRQASEAKDQFLASMSHELRTPLASVIGNSELLLQRLSNHEDRELARQIEIAGHNQLALIRDVLEISKIEGGSVVIDEAPFDLSKTLAELEHLFSYQAKQSNLSLQLTLSDMPAYQLLGDAPHLKQALHCLIDNALKFTEEGGIEIHASATAEQIHIRIIDSGIGISPEIMGTLFERFQQADTSISRRFGGSGLGLYIASNIAALMGGSIEVDSQIGRGSTFQLNLPCRLSDIPLYTPASEIENKAGSSSATRFHGHVLIAEDTPEMWMLMEAILQNMGIETSVAKNGQEAMEIALSNPFDLILMDMQMPVMDGIEATSILRQVGYVQPIAALTANIMPKYREQFEEAGCDAFLNKPVDKSALLQVLRRYLQPAAEGNTPRPQVESALEISDDLLQIFMERLATMAPSLESALRYEQWDEVRSVAHNIKGSGSSFGHPELTKMGKEVCDAIDYGEIDKIPRLAEPLLAQMQRVLQQPTA